MDPPPKLAPDHYSPLLEEEVKTNTFGDGGGFLTRLNVLREILIISLKIFINYQTPRKVQLADLGEDLVFNRPGVGGAVLQSPL